MLLNDKYTPKSFKESIVNKQIINKLKNVTKDSFMNIIFYGINGIFRNFKQLLTIYCKT